MIGKVMKGFRLEHRMKGKYYNKLNLWQVSVRMVSVKGQGRLVVCKEKVWVVYNQDKVNVGEGKCSLNKAFDTVHCIYITLYTMQKCIFVVKIAQAWVVALMQLYVVICLWEKFTNSSVIETYCSYAASFQVYSIRKLIFVFQQRIASQL